MLTTSQNMIFRTSSYSAPKRENCVEVAADLPHGAAVRDSQHPAQGHLNVPTVEWTAFLAEVRRDRL